MKTIGIDIGSSTSPMAIAILDDKNISRSSTLKQKKGMHFYDFLVEVYNYIKKEAVECDRAAIEATYYHAVQFTNKRGQKQMMPLKSANERHQRLIGVVICALSMNSKDFPIELIAPTSIKKRVGGSGKCDKIQVAKGILNFTTSPEKVNTLIEEKRFDETDAIAIALAGFMEGV